MISCSRLMHAHWDNKVQYKVQWIDKTSLKWATEEWFSSEFENSVLLNGVSSGQQPVSSHSCWMYVRAGRPAFARPCVGIHKSTSLMSSSLLLQHVRIQVVVLKTCLGRWTIGRSGERGSGISVLPARYDDDDDDDDDDEMECPTNWIIAHFFSSCLQILLKSFPVSEWGLNYFETNGFSCSFILWGCPVWSRFMISSYCFHFQMMALIVLMVHWRSFDILFHDNGGQLSLSELPERALLSFLLWKCSSVPSRNLMFI